jgi:hypothetical protein
MCYHTILFMGYMHTALKLEYSETSIYRSG